MILLTRWQYSKEEWRQFLRWKSRKKGWLFFLAGKCWPGPKKIPEIRIMADRVWVNQEHEPFQNGMRHFREIHIREAGAINILEISYEQGNRVRGINIPIPKGKLREAFAVQERLSIDHASIG